VGKVLRRMLVEEERGRVEESRGNKK
jgi:hypothetical protein